MLSSNCQSLASMWLRTSAFMVPWSACLWFLRNLGSVPLSEGYRFVLGFLILESAKHQRPITNY